MFEKTQWHSSRLQCNTTLCRWGHSGQPVLVFPTAGGDAEEVERFKMIYVLEPLLAAGRIKIYSCDSVAGRVWFNKEGSPEHRMWMTHQFHQYVKHEVAPAIRMDCKSPDIDIWVAGASIGAFHAAAVTCRFPDIFSRALAMSGTFDLLRFIERPDPTEYFFVSSPLHFVPTLAGRHLDMLRRRHIHIASGEGKWEAINESFRLGQTLGAKGIPNWVDSWGKDYDHDWTTWRAMMPKYLGEWTDPAKNAQANANGRASSHPAEAKS
jgi:esterase/lipase superfamily enzyme